MDKKEIRTKFLSLPKKVEIGPETLGLPANLYDLSGKDWAGENPLYVVFEQLLREGHFFLTGNGKVVRI